MNPGDLIYLTGSVSCWYRVRQRRLAVQADTCLLVLRPHEDFLNEVCCLTEAGDVIDVDAPILVNNTRIISRSKRTSP